MLEIHGILPPLYLILLLGVALVPYHKQKREAGLGIMAVKAKCEYKLCIYLST
jgi:hypothetical protein